MSPFLITTYPLKGSTAWSKSRREGKRLLKPFCVKDRWGFNQGGTTEVERRSRIPDVFVGKKRRTKGNFKVRGFHITEEIREAVAHGYWKILTPEAA